MLGQRPITTIKVFDAEVLAAEGVALSPVIDLREINQNNNFSLEYTSVGTGTLEIKYLVCSTKGGTYLDTGTALGTTLAAGSDLIAFASGEPFLAPFMKIRIEEDGDANGITVTARLNVQ